MFTNQRRIITQKSEAGFWIRHRLQQATQFSWDFMQELPLYFQHDVIIQHLQQNKRKTNVGWRRKENQGRVPNTEGMKLGANIHQCHRVLFYSRKGAHLERRYQPPNKSPKQSRWKKRFCVNCLYQLYLPSVKVGRHFS